VFGMDHPLMENSECAGRELSTHDPVYHLRWSRGLDGIDPIDSVDWIDCGPPSIPSILSTPSIQSNRCRRQAAWGKQVWPFEGPAKRWGVMTKRFI